MQEDIMGIKMDICRFMTEIAQEGVNPRNIEPIYMAAVAAEKIMKMEVLEQEMEGGYSGRGYSREGGGNAGGGYSGRRGGYSRESGGYSGRGNSYDSGDSYGRDMRGRYSRDGNEMMQKLQEMMEEADPEQRKALERCMRQLKMGE